MPEEDVKLVIEKHPGLGNRIGISRDVAARLQVQTGDLVSVQSPSQGIRSDIAVEVLDDVYPFIVQIDPGMLDLLKIKSVDLKLARATYKGLAAREARAMASQATRTAAAPATAPASVAPAPVPAAPAAAPERWMLIPKQTDSYQCPIVDDQGNAIYGIDPASGFPLDSAMHPYMSAFYFDPNAKPATSAPDAVTSAVPAPRPPQTSPAPRAPQAPKASPAPRAPQAPKAPQGASIPKAQAPPLPQPQASMASKPEARTVQVLDPNQSDKFGVQITDASGNPIYGMDASNTCVLDSAGQPCLMARWHEVELVEETSMAKFNSVLIIDISRSMMARDLEVKDADTAIRSIKVSMKSQVIQDFLNQFKDGTAVPRRMGAALAAIMFLSEKIARGHGEKVAVVRFADVAESLDFDGLAFSDNQITAQDILETTAISIVEKIGNSYGQATEIGKALFLTLELARLMQDMDSASGEVHPVMCLLLTDGYPTDDEAFINAIEAIRKNKNIVLHIIGLGSLNVELMTKAAEACGGEFFMPADVGQLLFWYMKKASEFQPRKQVAESESTGMQ